MREGKQKRIADHRVHTQTDTNETIGFLVPPFSLSSVSSRVVMSFDRRPAVFFFSFSFLFFLTVDGYFSISQMHMMMHVCCWLAETGRIGENGLWKTNHLPRSRLLHMITSILGMCWLAHWWWWRYIHFETSAFPVSTADKCKCILADEING